MGQTGSTLVSVKMSQTGLIDPQTFFYPVLYNFLYIINALLNGSNSVTSSITNTDLNVVQALNSNMIFMTMQEQEQPKGQEGHFQYLTQNEILNPMSPWQPYHQLEISPSSSYSNFTEEVEPIDDLRQFGYMYSGNENFTGIFGNEDHFPYEFYGGS